MAMQTFIVSFYHGIKGISVIYRDGEGRPRQEDGFSIRFPLGSSANERGSLKTIEEHLKKSEIEWLICDSKCWILDTTKLRIWSVANGVSKSFFTPLEWLKGVLEVTPEFETQPKRLAHRKTLTARDLESDKAITFTVYREDVEMNAGKRLFLSHKSLDKPMVKRIYNLLELVGFDPWLDSEEMPAGAELHRAVLQGLKDSCAAVFFVTDNFQDKKYLAGEISDAIQQKTEKGDRFAIITLVFPSADESKVPDLLRRYIWKHVKDEADAVSEIIKGLPIEVGPVRWKKGV